MSRQESHFYFPMNSLVSNATSYEVQSSIIRKDCSGWSEYALKIPFRNLMKVRIIGKKYKTLAKRYWNEWIVKRIEMKHNGSGRGIPINSARTLTPQERENIECVEDLVIDNKINITNYLLNYIKFRAFNSFFFYLER